MSSAISDTMIFIKELKSLLNGGEPGERFYFVSWGKDPCIKIIQLSRADISVQNNSPIAVFIRTHYFIFNILTFKREKKILCPTLS